MRGLTAARDSSANAWDDLRADDGLHTARPQALAPPDASRQRRPPNVLGHLLHQP